MGCHWGERIEGSSVRHTAVLQSEGGEGVHNPNARRVGMGSEPGLRGRVHRRDGGERRARNTTYNGEN